MKEKLIIFFILFSFLVFAQEDISTYNEKNGYYKIDYPKNWEVSENLENNNQVSFYPEDETIVAGVIFGDLGMESDAKFILEETLKYLNVENLVSENDSYATEEELKNWNADSANASAFKMEQDGENFSCILIVMTKGTFYYSLMFIINPNYVKEEETFHIVNNILNSFRILK
ncbi:MAG TPA: hypothetical protein PLD75_00040 [Spirochaetota bacterium]|nr:hypothetical protein [Spirochaetota bacterium]